MEGAARREGSAWVPITERQIPIQKVRDAVVWDDGNESMLYVAGDFGKLPDGSVASYVARRRSDGTWEDVGQGLNGFVLALTSHNGTLRGSPNDASGVYAIGFFDSTSFGGPGGTMLNGVARFDGTSWQPMGGGLDMAPVGLNFPDWDLRIYEDALGPRLYAVGSFSQIPATGTLTPERLAIWDGASWSRLPLQPQFTFFSPSCFEVWDDGNGEALFIGGQGFPAPFPQGGLVLMVRFDGFTTQIIADPTYMNLGNTPRATDIAVFDDGGGEKLWISGDSRNSISVFMDGGLATWDGSVWESKTTLFNDGGNELVHALDLSGSPTLLMAGEGDFNTGRPMGIVDVLSGDFEPTDSAPTALFEAPASQGPGTSVYLGGESLEYVAPLLVDGFAERRVLCSTGETYCFGEGETIPGCTACPCGNEAPLGSRGGCLNVSGRGTRLFASGEPSVANDTLRFEIRDMTPLTLGVLFSGENRLPANPNNPCFGLNTGIMDANIADGLRCMGGSTTRRHGGRGSNADGAIGVTTPGWGLGSGPPGGLIDFAGFVAGQTRHFQVFHRDAVAGGCGTGVNTSQGVTIQFQP